MEIKSLYKSIFILLFFSCNVIFAAEKSLDSVTVTANKVEENILNVPQSITVVNDLEIDEKRIKDINDFTKSIPNINSSLMGYFNKVNIRGLNTSTYTNNNPIVIYIDGVPTTNRIGYDIPFNNVERIEVLRGPQGTLYGKNAIGGVINVITKEPENQWTGNLGLEYGNNNSQYSKFDTSGALIEDKLFLDLNALYSYTDGWIENTQKGMDKKANKENQHNIGINLTYKANDKLKIKTSILNQYKKINGYGNSVMLKGNDTPDNVNRDDYKKINFNNNTYTKFDINSQSLSLNYLFNNFTLDSVTTHKYLKSDGDYDMDYGNGNSLYKDLIQFQHSTTETITQEIRFSNSKSQLLKWVTGIYLEREVYKNNRYGMQFPGSSMGTSFDWDFDDISKTTSNTQAIFSQVMIPFYDKFEFTIGGRYQNIKKDFISNQYSNPIGTTGAQANPSVDFEHSWKVFLPKTSLAYKINDSMTTYASVSKGYMPGGYNYWTSSNIESENRFDPQSSINYEIGLKGSSGNLDYTASVFYMDIKDLHISIFDPSSGKTITSNVDSAKSIGLELEMNYFINDSWKLSSALGITKAKYNSDYLTRLNGISVQNNKNTIENTPEYTLNIGLQYTNDNGFYSKFDIYGKGKTYFNPENTWKQNSFFTADLKIGYLLDDYDIYVYAKNITDEEYLTSVSQQSAGEMVSFGQERMFGIGLKYTF